MTPSNNAALGTILDLNDRFSDAVRAGEKSERDKLLVQSEGWLYLSNLGGLTRTGEQDGQPIFDTSDGIKSLLAERNIKNKVDAFNHCAQLVMGYVIETIADKDAKKKARNLVDRGAKLYRAFQHFNVSDIGSASDIAGWVEANGGIDGVWRRLNEALGGDIARDEDRAADLTAVEEAFATNSIKVTSKEVLPADLTLAITQADPSGGVSLLSLPAVPAEVIEQLTPFLPYLDAKMPDEVRYWANISTICRMTERQESAEPARPNEEQHAGSPLLPSLPIVRLTAPREAVVAPSRVAAGIIVYASAKVDTVLPAKLAWPLHLNGTSTKSLIKNLAGGFSRASFNGVSFNLNTDKLSFTSRTTRIKEFEVRTLPMTAFGSSRHSSQWTIDVRSFTSACTSRIELPGGMLPQELKRFSAKAAASRHPTILTITNGELSLALGEGAQSLGIASSGDKSATVTVASSDLDKVVRTIADLQPSWLDVDIDKGGLVRLTCETRIAFYVIFVPILLEGGARSPALIDRITRLGSEGPGAQPELADAA